MARDAEIGQMKDQQPATVESYSSGEAVRTKEKADIEAEMEIKEPI